MSIKLEHRLNRLEQRSPIAATIVILQSFIHAPLSGYDMGVESCERLERRVGEPEANLLERAIALAPAARGVQILREVRASATYLK